METNTFFNHLRHLTTTIGVLVTVNEYSSRMPWMYPLLLLLSSAAYEVAGYQMMSVVSNFYKFIIDKDRQSFFLLLLKSGFLSVFIVLFKSFATFFSERCYLQWRIHMVHYLHDRYFNAKVVKLFVENGINSSSHLDNCDQRITADVYTWSQSMSKLVHNVILLPILVMFYTYYTYDVLGWFAPVSCYVYFFLSTVASTSFIRTVSSLSFDQDRLEGSLRFLHSQFRLNIGTIVLLRGEKSERLRVEKSFSQLTMNQRQLIYSRLLLNYVSNWSSYLGSIVNYAVVGVSVLYFTSSANGLDEGETAAFISRGSLACMYLVSTFSTLMDSVEIFSDLLSSSGRISQLIKALNDTMDEKLAITGMKLSNPWYSGHGDPRPLAIRPREDDESSSTYGYLSPSISPGYTPLPTEIVKGEADKKTEPLLLSTESKFVMTVSPLALHVTPLVAVLHSSKAQGDQRELLCVRRVDIWTPWGPPPLSSCIEGRTAAGDTGQGRQSHSKVKRRIGKARRLLLKDVSFTVNKGMHLLISGPSGSGKSSLLRTLAQVSGFHASAAASSSAAGGNDLEERISCIDYFVSLSSVYFGSQTPYCFEGTLSDNLRYPHLRESFDPGRERDEMAYTLKLVRLEHLIPHLLSEDKDDESICGYDRDEGGSQNTNGIDDCCGCGCSCGSCRSGNYHEENVSEETKLCQCPVCIFDLCETNIMVGEGYNDNAGSTTMDWPQILSPGEQQRIAIARVLCHNLRVLRNEATKQKFMCCPPAEDSLDSNEPECAIFELLILDEPTSALDQGDEAAIFNLLTTRGPEFGIKATITVAHGSSLRSFCTHELRLRGPAPDDNMVEGELRMRRIMT